MLLSDKVTYLTYYLYNLSFMLEALSQCFVYLDSFTKPVTGLGAVFGRLHSTGRRVGKE